MLPSSSYAAEAYAAADGGVADGAVGDVDGSGGARSWPAWDMWMRLFWVNGKK